MKKPFKEITLLIVLPLVLMSMFLGVIGTAHSTIVAHASRITKDRSQSTDIPIPCEDSLCKDFKIWENNFLAFEKDFQDSVFV